MTNETKDGFSGTGAPKRRWWRRLIGPVVVVAVLGGIGYVVLKPHKGAGPGEFGGPPGGGPGGPPAAGRSAWADQTVSVGAAVAAKGDIDVTLGALGTVTPLVTVTVKTQIAGTLTAIGFQEGQTVKAGDFLAQVDPRPYQATLDQYLGQLAKDQALLRDAQVNLDRYDRLLAEDSVARQTRDTQASLVAQYKGAVATDQAQVASARLNLAYCRIVAPIGGRVGLRQVDLGNYVQTSDADGIVVITQMHPMSVKFAIPEDDLPKVLKRLRAGATLAAIAYDRGQTTELARGRLTTVDNQIDTATGTVKMRAEFDNADDILFPNQFVNIRLLVDVVSDVVVVPAAAIQRGTPGTFVYLIGADGTVSVRPVILGPSSGDKVSVTAGLAFGDKVVVDGADKLREGAKVSIPAERPARADKATGATGAAPAAERRAP